MFLYLARHAWAGHFGDPGWPDDSLRELTPEGIERYRRVVSCLAERGFAPQLIASSPYARCRQTADIIADIVPGNPQLVESEMLAPGADLADLLAWTGNYLDRNVCWVGHNPDMEWLAGALFSDGSARIRFAKGAIAAIRFDGVLGVGDGELYWHATAKSLGV